MNDPRPTRRAMLAGLALAGGSMVTAGWPGAARAAGSARVVVIGGGFAGATCARALCRVSPGLDVTLVEANPAYVAAPFSNAVIAGLRDLASQTFGYDQLRRAGVKVAIGVAAAIDTAARSVRLADGTTLPYDRLVLAPGIDIRWDGLPGYTPEAAEKMPHAWKAGAQTTLLRRQLEAMDDGGVVLLSAPVTPYRCPPGPYERASLIAHYLKTRKPKSKLILLDAKDTFSKQKLFQEAWAQLYPGLLQWIGVSSGARVTEVDPAAMTLTTDFDSYKGDVINIVPPQKAGAVAALAGVADASGWCPVDPVTFESPLQPGVHVIGDAAILGAVPKSASSANVEGRLAAIAVISRLVGDPVPVPRIVNACYSLAAPGYGFSIAGVYQPSGTLYADIEGAGGTSPLAAAAEIRAREADFADRWYASITQDVFG